MILKRLKRFFLRTLGFIVFLAAVHFTVSAFYGPWIRSDTEYEISRRQFEKSKEEISILFLGDSHVRSAVNPEYIPGAFNFSLDGENYIMTYYKMRYYLKDKDLDLKMVVLPIDLHSFSSYRGNRFPDPVFWGRYINYIELGQEKGSMPSFIKKTLQSEFAYLGGYDEMIEKFFSPAENARKIVQGYLPRNGDFSTASDQASMELAHKRVSIHFSGQDFVDEHLFIYFIKLLTLLEENGIEVVLVRYPVTNQYFHFAASILPVFDYVNIMEDQLKQQGFEYQILDYHDLFWGRNDLFVDSDHLNKFGAEELSKILQEDLAGIE